MDARKLSAMACSFHLVFGNCRQKPEKKKEEKKKINNKTETPQDNLDLARSSNLPPPSRLLK